MARGSEFYYTQTVIGDCGHPCDGWPLVSGIGGSLPHSVICDVCTRERYGIEGGEPIGVWVRVVPEPKKRAAKPKPKKNKETAFWEQFML